MTDEELRQHVVESHSHREATARTNSMSKIKSWHDWDHTVDFTHNHDSTDNYEEK